MHCLNVHNVNQGLAEGLRLLTTQGVQQPSRNGPVLVMREPVATTYKDPTARVLFSPIRDANPFFHFMEGLWMLNGQNDLDWLTQFLPSYKDFSDDGHTVHGAYGYRWRKHFGFDQLQLMIEELKRSPTTRRAVLSMWDPQADLNNLMGKDVPCNTHAYFATWQGRVDMHVCNRSNDVIWGCYGANAVHFSMLQEYVAACVGLPVGDYVQMSVNFHLYIDTLDKLMLKMEENTAVQFLVDETRTADLYTMDETYHQPRQRPAGHAPRRVPMMQTTQQTLDLELALFMEEPYRAEPGVYDEPFFADVAVPMLSAWHAYKDGRHAGSFEHAAAIKAGDWNIACTQWLERRAERRQAKQNLEV